MPPFTYNSPYNGFRLFLSHRRSRVTVCVGIYTAVGAASPKGGDIARTGLPATWHEPCVIHSSPGAKERTDYSLMYKFRQKRGFTLIELMVVVAIIGILAAIAVPAFMTYIRRSKGAEASTNLNALYKALASYYVQDGTAQRGLTGTSLSNCLVDDQAMTPANPNAVKQQSTLSVPGFAISDYVYCGYMIESSGEVCNVQSDTDIYTLRAHGDLDGDNVNSTFELAVRSSTDGVYKSGGFYINDETE